MKRPDPRALRAAFVPFGLVLLALPGASQSRARYTLGPGQAPGLGGYARQILPVDDVNADGRADYVLATPVDGGTNAGLVEMIDGASGLVLWSLVGAPGENLGSALIPVTGSITFASTRALWIASPGAALIDQLVPFDPVTGTRAAPSTYGSTGMTPVLGACLLDDDVDLAQPDGHPDVAVLQPGAVALLSSSILRVGVPAVLTSFSRLPQELTLCAAGDFFGTGLPSCVALGAQALNQVRILDLLTGQEKVFVGPSVGPLVSGMGASLARDVKNDRVLFGAPSSYANLGAVGALQANVLPVELFRGSTGTPELGLAVAVGTTDGDNFVDVLAGGRDLAVLESSRTGRGPVGQPIGVPQSFGSSLAFVGDTDGDGFDDFVIANPNRRNAYTYHGGGHGLPMTSFGSGCAPAGTAPGLQSLFPLKIGASVVVTASSSNPGPILLFFGAPDPLGTPLGGGCTQWLSNPICLLTMAPNAPALVGPLPATMLGQELALQGTQLLGGGGFAFTNGLRGLVGW